MSDAYDIDFGALERATTVGQPISPVEVQEIADRKVQEDNADLNRKPGRSPGTEPLIRQDDPDSDRVWLRTKRIFHTDNGWYVGTREDNLGPFPDRKLAVIELKRYVRKLKRQKQDAVEDSFVDARGSAEANTIRDYLTTEFSCLVLERLSDVVRFRIESDPRHWIYIPLEFLVDKDGGPAAIIEMINKADLIDTLKSSESPQHRAIQRDGIRVVDETYGKPNI
ncbi:MAG: DUF6316 family protein [Gammaproteobacteria bacterium]